MPKYTIVTLQSQLTHPLRQALLRPNQTLAEMAFDGDDLSTSRHFGGQSESGELQGIVSIYLRPYPPTEQNAWQIRAMATTPEARGTGLGRALLKAAEAYAFSCEQNASIQKVTIQKTTIQKATIQKAKVQKATLVWANARTSALGFYRACGYEVLPPVFEIAGVGPHQLIVREINESTPGNW